MKAITLWQPWASLVACGAKRFETRSWGTSYRGQIAIHAAAKDPFSIIKHYAINHVSAMYNALRGKGFKVDPTFRNLPLGAVVATATLTECWQVIKHTPTAVVLRQSNGVGEDKIPIDAPYLMFGDYSVGRYIWGLADIRALPEPIPAKGKQGLWNWEEGSAENG